MVRSLVFAFPVVPRNYTWFDAANNRGLAPRTASHFALRAFREVANPSTVSGTRGLRVLTIPGRSYRIRLHVSACYPKNRFVEPLNRPVLTGGQLSPILFASSISSTYGLV